MFVEMDCWKTELADRRTFLSVSSAKAYVPVGGKTQVYLGKSDWFDLTSVSVGLRGAVSN